MSDTFWDAFPMYLAIGMTYEEYWEKDPRLVISYRKAQKHKLEEINYSAWLNGVYVMRALQSGIPVILNGIVKEVISLPNFPDKPIDFSEDREKKQEEQQMQLQIARMQEIANQFNKSFAKKKASAEKT